MKERQPAVYILASRRNGTLYVGVTSDLLGRIWIHRSKLTESFTSQHSVHMLAYYELYSDMYSALTREKQIKKWNRYWKLRLIESVNPGWVDLFDSILRGTGSPPARG